MTDVQKSNCCDVCYERTSNKSIRKTEDSCCLIEVKVGQKKKIYLCEEHAAEMVSSLTASLEKGRFMASMIM